MKILKLLIAFCLIANVTTIQAQNAIPATGGNASGSGGTSDYTVGQVVYTTNSGTNGSVAQGVQQPYEISTVTGIEEALGIMLECLIYPNPTNDFLTLKVENYDIQNLWYKLFDASGRLLESKKVTGNETQISMVSLSPSVYFLKVADNQKDIKTFTIIKK